MRIKRSKTNLRDSVVRYFPWVEDEWPLVERAAELDELWSSLGGEDAAVVLVGAPGVGKTRLARECLRSARRQGFGTASATATHSSRSIPFGAVAGLPSSMHQTGPPVEDMAGWIRRSLSAIAEQQARGRRFLLVVDDAHLLDDESASLVHHIVTAGVAAVLVTLHDGEPAPEAIVALWKDRVAKRQDLAKLGTDAVGRLLCSALGNPVDPAAVADLARRCDGNILFLRELVLGGIADGVLRDDGGIWRLMGELTPSTRLVELIETRLAHLQPAERELLELVAYGEPVSSAELDVVGVLDLAVQLERKKLLTSRLIDHRLEVRLTNPLDAEVLRARLPALRRGTIARTLIAASEAVGTRGSGHTLRLATWSLDACQSSPDLFLAGAAAARWDYDFLLAERLARAAVDTGAGFEAALMAAQLARLNGRAEQAAAELADLAVQAVDDTQRGRVAATRLGHLGFFLGEAGEAQRLADEAEAAIADPVWRADILARRSALLLGRDGPRAAADAALPLLEYVKGPAYVWASQVASLSLGRLGRVRAALDTAERGYLAHTALDEPVESYPWAHIFMRCEALAWSGQLGEAERIAVEQYQQSLADRSPEAQAWFAWHLAKFAGERGNLRMAEVHGREAVALFRQLSEPQFVCWCLIDLALILALSGNAEGAADALATVDGLGVQSGYFMGVDPLHARAWRAVAENNLVQAQRMFEEAADVGSAIGDAMGEASALHAQARLGGAAVVSSRLSVLATQTESELVAVRARHTTALIRNDARSLASASVEFETMGATLLAAEASADAVAAWLDSDRPQEAADEARRARSLVALTGGARTPALSRLEEPVRLTPAEREAAVLAANGESNKEIADKLGVSVRTVEGRLQRVYNKLGIEKRSQLAVGVDPLVAT